MARKTSYKPEYTKQAAKLCFLGATDAMLGDFFEVSEQTINNWKKDFPEFKEALVEAKKALDTKVERSLFERATGYSHPEEKVFCQNGEVIVHNSTKHYPPDSTSMIFWLKNRQPEKWRDKQEIELSKRPLVKTTRKRFDGE